MMEHLRAWAGGSLLCCSAIAYATLPAEQAVFLAQAGFSLAALSHAATGFLVIEGRGASKCAGSSGTVFSAVWAAICTVLQVALAFALTAALQVKVGADGAVWLLVTGCVGLFILFGIAILRYQSMFTTQFGQHETILQRASSAEPSRS